MSRRAQKQLVDQRFAILRNNKARKGFKWGFSDKTGWEWLDLIAKLAVPLILGIATISLSQQQANLAQQQHNNDQNIANQQRLQDQAIALDQQRQATLVKYQDDMRDFLLHDGLLTSKQGDEIRVIALTETLSAMRQLDGKRNSFLVQLLQDAGLIGAERTTIKGHNIIKGRYIVTFESADLSSTNLSGANLSYADLSHANLSNTDLSSVIDLSNFISVLEAQYTNLDNANLSYARLTNANLSYARLTNANLLSTNLFKANLSHADFYGADLSHANLDIAHLSHAVLDGTDLSHTAIVGADLSNAALVGADLSHADLFSANLSDTNLSNAALVGADLSQALLNNAGLTQQQLDQVYSCKGAILSPGLTCHHNI